MTVDKHSQNIIQKLLRRQWQWVISLLIAICHLSLLPSPCRAQWQNHLAYYEPQNICEAGNTLFVLASNDLYLYNKNDQSITTLDKVNGLSDTNISHIAWNQQAKRLIAVYQNANIDLIDLEGNIINISSLYMKTMTEDKTVAKITIDGIYAWLHCGFGLVKVNVRNAEITDTYTPQHPEYPSQLPEYDEQKDFQANLPLVASLSPIGPQYNHFYESKFYNGKLYTTGGNFLSGVVQMNYPGCVQVLSDNEWNVYQGQKEIEQTTGYSYEDINCIDIDPTDESHVAVGGRCGLYEFKNGRLLKYHNKDNSPLRGAMDRGTELGYNYTLVHGVKFDKTGNLWVLNSQAKDVNLLKLTAQGEWEDHYQEKLANSEGVAQEGMRNLFFDSRGYLWFVNTAWRDPSLMCYNTNTDELIKYSTFVNQDGTHYSPNSVYCVTEDREGNIWLGTNIGPYMIQKSEVGEREVTMQQIKVPRNDGSNYADYLLNGVSINHIAIDGGNRKWFATSGSGVFLISADNLTQISNFKEDNSKLLSNNITSVSINPKTGKVYFLTDKGLCSYMSDATEPSEEMTKDNVYAYPNPVTPDYKGLITVTGLTFNADVKICATNGALVAEGRSNGGTFTWDGCDREGRRVVSGIYMVVTATADGKKGTVCRIAVIN